MDLEYIAPPTCATFMKSNAYGRIIAGPVGSGKTTACIIELLRRSLMQKPAPDGYRYTRFAVVRQTLKQLKDTVLKDCHDWIGAYGLGTWKVSESTYHLLFDDVRSEWVFIPLETEEDQGRLLSMQLTGTFMSECIDMDIGLLGPISGRLGRYPAGARGNPTWHGIIADTNMPTEMTPWHQFMENLPPDWQRFIQPSGLAPHAENLNNLVQTDATKALPFDHPVRLAQGRHYYERFINMYGADHEWVKRYVYAEYGDDPSGSAVFKNTFRTNFHIVDETFLIPGYPLIIGQDFGRNPWSLICQPDHLGRLIVHEEVPGRNVGLEKHVMQSLRPRLMHERYLGFKYAIVGDPSGVAKGSVSEESCFDALKRFGLIAFPAPTNDIGPRIRSVEALLGRQTNGGPSLLINRGGCPHLCRAMSGGYRYTKTKKGTLKVITAAGKTAQPDKDDPQGYSHVCDDLQYVCLVVHGQMLPYIRSHMIPKSRDMRPRVTSAGWT